MEYGGKQRMKEAETKKRGGIRRGRVTHRDLQIVGHLATVRYLSTEQIAKLVFPCRVERVVRARLCVLAGEGRTGLGQPLLRRLVHWTHDGMTVPVWALTSAGYLTSQKVLGREVKVPVMDIADAFMNHTLMLNDLYVGIAARQVEAEARKADAALGQHASPQERAKRLERLYAKARDDNFRWIPEEGRCLPWRAYDEKQGDTFERKIYPDAIVELAPAKRRFFVECETGAHSIVARNRDKAGATIAKVGRYYQFMNGVADSHARSTYYEKAFPDRWPAEVLFLVHSELRRRHVVDALREWMKGGGRENIQVRVLTQEGALAELLPLVGAAPPQTPATALALTAAELSSLQTFYKTTVDAAKKVRDAARAAGKDPPEYPNGTHETHALITRLLSATTGKAA
jgi:hypothetical protein